MTLNRNVYEKHIQARQKEEEEKSSQRMEKIAARLIEINQELWGQAKSVKENWYA